jgi:thioesterase domain-containing protein
MVPSELVFLDSLPLTPNGKINRAALPSTSGAQSAESRDGAFANDVEADLAQIWSEVLGVPSVSATDDFFDLGGHSLLAITLFSRIYDRFGQSLAIGTLFERPTVRGLAALLPAPAAHGPNSTLHLLQGSGSRPPILLMHGIDGSLWDSMRLAKHLGNQRPVYGLQTIITDESSDLTVEAMAARCVAEIREKVPKGPYHIGGFCAAAKTAIEVAKQLRAEGEDVGLVAVFDYGMGEPSLPRSAAGAVFDFLRNLPLWIVYDLVPVGPRRVAGRLSSRIRLAFGAVTRRLRPQKTEAQPDIRDALGIWMYTTDQARILAMMWNAFERYTLRPYAGRVALFKPRAERLVPPRRPRDLGWGRIATGGVDVITVPGSHETMLEETFVPKVAARLAEVLDRADRMANVPPGAGSQPGRDSGDSGR